MLAWNADDEISEVPWASLKDLDSLAMAKGTMLLRSIPAKPVLCWLGNASTQHPVGDFAVPSRMASGVFRVPRESKRSIGWAWETVEGSAEEGGEDGGGESGDQASRKRKEPSPAVAAGGGDGAEQRQQQQEEDASQEAARRRVSHRPGAGVRVSPVGSGGRLGEVGGPGANRGAPMVIKVGGLTAVNSCQARSTRVAVASHSQLF